ncbi:MAG TPA: glycosyl transferase family 1 [Balneolaceae bacterium]|nr:glycosyl transferase family 1 [Balneolaceae bacterium]
MNCRICIVLISEYIMQKGSVSLLYLVVFFTVVNCEKPTDNTLLVDVNATPETVALYKNLKQLSGEHSLFGHQATLAYGRTWMGDSSRSDVKDVTGSFPALYGWDVADFLPDPRLNEQQNDQKRKKSLDFAKEGLARGGVLTYAWHMRNPVTGRSFYDTTRAVSAILPGGEKHQQYKHTLDEVAAYFRELSPMPVIFRPFHEHNGDWFWWGKGLCTEEEYRALWRFTFNYLVNEKEVHNLIWAFSPDRSRTNIHTFKRDYFYGYPGDNFVDIIGLDNYWDVGHPANTASPPVRAEQFIKSLTMTSEIADSLGKITALTETGLEAIPDSTFWTKTLLKGMLANASTQKMVYVQVWRNANYEREQRDHYYAPFPGQVSAPDFIKFRNTEFVLFEDELPDLYSIDR